MSRRDLQIYYGCPCPTNGFQLRLVLLFFGRVLRLLPIEVRLVFELFLEFLAAPVEPPFAFAICFPLHQSSLQTNAQVHCDMLLVLRTAMLNWLPGGTVMR